MSNQNDLQEAIGKIIEMATSDEDLKNDLVNKPKETLSVFGIDVDDDVKFVFTNGEKVEEDDSTIVIDLSEAEEEEMDLEESSLENVTGGAGGFFSFAQHIDRLGEKFQSMSITPGDDDSASPIGRAGGIEDVPHIRDSRISRVATQGWGKARATFSFRGNTGQGQFRPDQGHSRPPAGNMDFGDYS